MKSSRRPIGFVHRNMDAPIRAAEVARELGLATAQWVRQKPLRRGLKKLSDFGFCEKRVACVKKKRI